MNELPQPRHSPHGFGLLSMNDVPFLEHTLHLVASKHGNIRMLELGVANGGTTAGIYNHCQKMKWPFSWIGMDHKIGRPEFPLGDWGKFIEGDLYHPQNWQQVPDDINLLFIDPCHCTSHTVEAFNLFERNVIRDGYILFHDTCSHPDWQGKWEQCKPDRFIGTREALKLLRLDKESLVAVADNSNYEYIGEQDRGTGQGMYLVQRTYRF